MMIEVNELNDSLLINIVIPLKKKIEDFMELLKEKRTYHNASNINRFEALNSGFERFFE